LKLVPGKLLEPLRWSRPRMIFVNSMSDLFHEEVPDEYIFAVAEMMSTAAWHTYQVLTKRAGRLHGLLNGAMRSYAAQRHIWWGVSVEDRRHGVPRIDQLRTTPAAVRFLSIEPLLEDLGRIDLSGIHWVIAGGESGPGARPMKAAWIESVRDQCAAANIPFFFKQWGGVQKKKSGRILGGRTHDDRPLRITNAVPSRPHRERMIQEWEQRAGLDTRLVAPA
jgi:protein gp37